MTSGDNSGASRGEGANPKDPKLGLRFWVSIDSIEVAGFSECSAITVETETFDYAEGGENTFVHRLPVRTKYGNITLKRGLDSGQDLYHWFMRCIRQSGQRLERKNVTITIYDSELRPVETFQLHGAYPVKWTGPDLKADAGAVAIETLEFAHNGLLPVR